MIAVDRLVGVDDTIASALFNVGIFTTRDLLKRASTRDGRRAISIVTGIDEERILEWVHMADLMRINGIGPLYAKLLIDANVRTIKELAHSNDRDLYLRVAHANRRLNLVKKIPTILQIRDWIRQARRMSSTVMV